MTLDAYLDAHKISGAEFAKRIGVSEASLSRIKKGEQNITIDLMRAIIDASGGEVSADGLLIARAA